MTTQQLLDRLAILEKNQDDILTFASEGFDELTKEIALLREQLANQNVELPAEVEATLARIETKSTAGVAKAKELADVIQTTLPPEVPPS